MSDAFIVRRGGNGSGAVLTINAPAGVTAKITKGDKTKTKTVSNGGAAVFSGLSEGMWMASILDGTSLETTPVPVNVITNYHLTLSFFSATINITYPSGSTCTVSNGNITLTAPNTSGTWSCTVPEAGTWTVTATDGTNEKSQTVEIAQSGESVSVELACELILFRAGEGALVPLSVVKQSNSTTSIGTDSISFSTKASGYTQSIVVTDNAIDVTNYSTLVVTYTGSGTATTKFGLLSTKPYLEGSQIIDVNWIANGFAASVDVSAVSGLCYVGLFGYSNLTVTEVKLI